MDILKELVEHYDLTTIGAILTFLTILATFWKQVGEPVYNRTLKPIGQFFYSIYESPTRLHELNGKLDALLTELKPNGGSSIKDQLNRLESQVSISEVQRRMLLDASPHGVYITDAKGVCHWINETLRTKVAAKFSDITGENWISYVHPSDRKTVLDEWEYAIKNAINFNLHYRLQNLITGEAYPVHGVATPVKSFDGSVVGYNGIIYFL